MTQTRSRRRLIASIAAAALAPLSARAADLAHPNVVELFTSQGCASCVPALSNLILLDKQPDVLALSFGVTYWDQLGWKDEFAQPAFTLVFPQLPVQGALPDTQQLRRLSTVPTRITQRAQDGLTLDFRHRHARTQRDHRGRRRVVTRLDATQARGDR